MKFNMSLFELIFGQQQYVEASLFGQIIVHMNTIVLSILGAFYTYQLFLNIFSIFIKSKKFKDTDQLHEYIFVTSARNEETVIAQLITTIRALDYPQDKIKIHVIADNCTDRTKEIAESMGGVEVFERFNKVKVGKSYALEHYFDIVLKREYSDNFAGFIVVDTDNILDKNYLTEINKTYVEKNANLVASYRASTNMGDSIWTFGTGYSFLRECTLMHKGREKLGISSYVSGTGFFVSYAKMKKENGWHAHTMIEDIEFSTAHLYGGDRTYYNHDAIFYDEQPIRFKDSWKQRLRWVKGLFQVSRLYTWKIFKSIFARKKTLRERASFYESFIFTTPFPAFTIYWFIIYGVLSLINLAFTHDFTFLLNTYVFTLFDFTFGFFVFSVFMSYIISFTNWKRIKMHWFKKLFFPWFALVFMVSYAPMFIIAPFKKVEWKPIKHYGLKKPLD